MKRISIQIPRKYEPDILNPYGYIYITTNLVNNKRYLGRHCHEQIDSEYYGSGAGITRALKKYGKDNFICEPVDWASNNEELNEKEIWWIRFLGAKYSNLWYNYLSGGQGYCTEDVKGRKDSEETKKKKSKSHKGSKHSESTKIKMSESMKNRQNPSSDSEVRRKISNTLKHKYSTGEMVNPLKGTISETRKKQMSGKNNVNYKNRLGTLNYDSSGANNGRCVPVVCLDSTGKVLKTYSFIKEALTDGYLSGGIRSSISSGKPYKELYWRKVHD